MAKLTNDTIPPLEELAGMFQEETAQPFTAEMRQVLLVWEGHLREEVLDRQSAPLGEPHRWKLPDERESLTHRFVMTDHEGQVFRCPECNKVAHRPIEYKAYLTMGKYPDGRLGEIFCEISREGSFVSGIMDALTYTMSVGLQHGVPLEAFTKHYKHTKFQPSGMVEGAAKEMRGFFGSMLDYIAQYLEHKFITKPEGE